jgi:hypothetical protein
MFNTDVLIELQDVQNQLTNAALENEKNRLKIETMLTYATEIMAKLIAIEKLLSAKNDSTIQDGNPAA